MSSQSVFALPAATQNSLRSRSKTAGKRKRNARDGDLETSQQRDDLGSPDPGRIRSAEYTAVITPAERSQRRLAGLSLDQTPPPYPFPHARLPSKEYQTSPNDVYNGDEDGPAHNPKVRSRPYLRSQHIAAMMAVLHRSMMAKDYARAGRALGLLLRSEIAGHAIDIRSTGLWGIGAEILFCERSSTFTDTSNQAQHSTITRGGFERAKLYYERLMVQHPVHKTRPDVVNALDFCIAMFGLWVYITNQEASQLYERASSLDDGDVAVDVNLNLYEAKTWELSQARQIAEAIDMRMQDSMFGGFPELVRLRAMVALWIADLIEACIELEDDDVQQSYEQEHEDLLSANVEHMVIDPRPVSLPGARSAEATENRRLANTLFSKLDHAATEEADQE